MKQLFKIFLFLTLILLVIGTVSAARVVVNPVNETANKIFFDGVAHFNLSITNVGAEEAIYSWNANPVEWVIDSVTSARISAGETKHFDLAIRPRPSNYRGQGFYVVPLTVSTKGEAIKKSLVIYIKSLEDRYLDYTPSVALGASIPKEVDPQKPVTVQVSIRNRNMLNIENITLKIDGESFRKTVTFPLNGLEERTLEYRFDIDDLQLPGTYDLVLDLIYKNKTISTVNKYYDVIAFSKIVRDSQESKHFLRKSSVATLTNVGNVEKHVKTDIPITWYKSLFVSVDIEADNFEELSRGSWELILGPNESAVITVTENYWSLFLLIIILVLLFIGYFQFRSPIVLKKQIIVTGKDTEGVSEMKVRVFIRNRTAKSFFNVRVLDRVPNIAEVVPSTGLGVVEPSQIVRNERKGTLVKWDFDTLEAYEERIVTYTVRVRLKIIGTLGLPSVRIKFENVKGRQLTAESGRAIIGK